MALDGIRVLDLSQGVSGGYCTKLLGCLGAEVIKIEDPSHGDLSRRMGPFLQHLPNPETSATYLYLNTSKKSITLNLKTTSGAETLKRLLPSADVLVENFQPGTMSSMGLGYDELERVNARLVMASVTYFGQTGPYRDYKGNAMVGFAVTGQIHMTGEPDREPLMGAGYQPEYQAGLHAFDAIMAALYWREASGQGQHIDVSVMEAMAYYHEFAIATWTHVGTLNIRAGNQYPVGSHPLTIYPCKDGYISITIVTPQQNKSLLLLIQRPDLIGDPKFGTGANRWDHEKEFDDIVQPWFKERTMGEVVTRAQELRVPCTYVPTFPRLVEDAQLQARGYWVALEHPMVGWQLYAGAPFKMSETPWRAAPAPVLGEHNEEIYCGGLGLSKEELVRLRERDII